VKVFFDLTTGFRPRYELLPTIVDFPSPPIEFFEPRGIKSTVGVALKTIKQLADHLSPFIRLEFKRGFNDLLCGDGHHLSIPFPPAFAAPPGR
jgi:hypothetical protein